MFTSASLLVRLIFMKFGIDVQHLYQMSPLRSRSKFKDCQGHLFRARPIRHGDDTFAVNKSMPEVCQVRSSYCNGYVWICVKSVHTVALFIVQYTPLTGRCRWNLLLATVTELNWCMLSFTFKYQQCQMGWVEWSWHPVPSHRSVDWQQSCPDTWHRKYTKTTPIASAKRAITSKIKHAIKHKTSPARLAQLLHNCCSPH